MKPSVKLFLPIFKVNFANRSELDGPFLKPSNTSASFNL